METALPPEMMHCVNSPEMTVLQRQRTRLLRWQHEQGTAAFQQQVQSFYNNDGGGSSSGGSSLSFYRVNENLMGLGEVTNQCDMINPSPGIEYWGQLGNIEVPCLGFGGGIGAAADVSSSGYEVSCGNISRTASCATAAVEASAGGQSAAAAEKIGVLVGRDSLKKRKLERMQSIKDSEETRDRKIKGCFSETDTKLTEQSTSNSNGNKKDTKNRNCNNKDISASTSRDNLKAPDVQKPDFIHVRARRGQATDSHSLAERVRREKISERMKFLQDLVPGCNKVTGKAGMLDEIINYVQSLQRQVEFLSLKLATVNPRLDFEIDSLFPKEMVPACTSSFPTINMSSELTNRTYLHFDPSHQVVPCSGLDDMGIVNSDMGHQLTTSALMPVPEPFIDPSCFTPTANWDTGFQDLYNLDFQQGKASASATAPAYQSHQQYTGLIEHNNMKMDI